MANNLVLSGNLVSDPQTRKISDTLKVANFTLAVNDKVGPKKDQTTSFFDIVAWNVTADIVVQNFVKGSNVSIVGHLKQETYEDKQGNKVSKVRVVADEILNAPPRRTAKTSPVKEEVQF